MNSEEKKMDKIYKINDHITKRVLNKYGGSKKK